MPKIVTVTAGHSNTDPGAVHKDRTEADVVAECRNIVLHYLLAEDVVTRSDGTGKVNLPLKTAIQLVKGANVAVEFHCNAGPASARGVEALAQPKDKKLAQDLCAAVNGVLGIPVRGDKGYKPEDSGQHSRLGYVSAGGVILELFFISNAAELALWDAKKWLVGKAIAEVLVAHCNS